MSCGKSAKVSGAYDRTLEQLKKAGVEVAEFAKVMENPLKDMVMEGAAFAKDNGCDFIVALGGGAVLDSATGHFRHGDQRRRPVGLCLRRQRARANR